MIWHRNKETHRLKQSIDKQYSYGKEPEENIKLKIKYLEQQIELLKKYKDMERSDFRNNCYFSL